MIIYFHGLGGHNSSKADILEKQIGVPVTRFTYRNADEYFAGIESAIRLLRDTRDDRPSFVVGTSLGGFAATVVAEGSSAVASVVNPALRPWEVLEKHGEHEWAERTRTIMAETRARHPHGEGEFRACINADDERLGGEFDETINDKFTRKRIFAKGGHRATNFESEIVPVFMSDYLELVERGPEGEPDYGAFRDDSDG